MAIKIKKGTFPYTWVGFLYAVIFIALVVAGVIAIFQQNWDSLLLAIATAVLFIAPFIAEKQLKIYIPTFFTLLIGAFLYATLILGQIEQYYQKFWWWDVMLHSGSGLAFGLVGLVFILIVFRRGKVAANPFFLCLFAFCFALSIGLLWEVFEFSGDEIFHTNMQQRQTGVEDTMKDEIMDTLGALVGSTIGYFYLRNDLVTPIDEAINKTVRKNKKRKSTT